MQRAEMCLISEMRNSPSRLHFDVTPKWKRDCKPQQLFSSLPNINGTCRVLWRRVSYQTPDGGRSKTEIWFGPYPSVRPLAAGDGSGHDHHSEPQEEDEWMNEYFILQYGLHGHNLRCIFTSAKKFFLGFFFSKCWSWNEEQTIKCWNPGIAWRILDHYEMFHVNVSIRMTSLVRDIRLPVTGSTSLRPPVVHSKTQRQWRVLCSTF